LVHGLGAELGVFAYATDQSGSGRKIAQDLSIGVAAIDQDVQGGRSPIVFVGTLLLQSLQGPDGQGAQIALFHLLFIGLDGLAVRAFARLAWCGGLFEANGDHAHFLKDGIGLDPGLGVKRVIGGPIVKLPPEDGDQARDGVASGAEQVSQ